MRQPKIALEDLALSEQEYDLIIKLLGREPNELEIGLFGSMWSEHCGYKHSKLLLKLLKSESPRIIVGQGEENAGVLDIGDGLALVMKIESHNHPSAIEPYQGAATGIGGIVRDILAMGAKPIALLNSLRFGPLDKPRNRYLFTEVVRGVAGYGNCIGVPNVGGEISFSESYSGNPLVNAMCIGVVEQNKLARATSGKPGNILILVGSETGKDGIHGASGLASQSFEEKNELRTAVQVANPFLEKMLIESCLEITKTGLIVGLQDLGAAGLTSAAVEVASNGGSGIEIDVSFVPRRQTNMSPYEVMLSESQERMLVIIETHRLKKVTDIFNKWGLKSTVIGKTTEDGKARILDKGVLQGNIPISILTEPPMYEPKGELPDKLKELQQFDLNSLAVPLTNPNEILLKLLSSPNIASKEWAYRQYDHQVQTNTVVGPGSDAAILRIQGTTKGIAVTTDGNSRYCYLDPFTGGMIAVAEACRNISSVGAVPIGLTDCLNFGNPEKPETYYQLRECIKGISKASKALKVPIVSGNVSLYNETMGKDILPTPIIGGLGLLENVSMRVGMAFVEPGDKVILLGEEKPPDNVKSLAGSEYLEHIHGIVAGKPSINIKSEIAVQKACRRAINDGIIRSAHDCSDGGLAVAIAECCIASSLGFVSTCTIPSRWDSYFFGEAQSRILVTINEKMQSELEIVCTEEGVNWTEVGYVDGTSLKLRPLIDINIDIIINSWHKSIEQSINFESA